MSIRVFLALHFIGFHLLSFGQAFTGEHYYLFPINPGQQNFLAGTMGELRASHFHAGLDIKTGGQAGLPVYAAADGFISRIKVSTGGYGNAIYIDHPNLTTTVYAHLDHYETTIERYVLQKQYEEETFEIDLFLKRDVIPVKRGELIGFSGNTGSSSGPHLHFEIRDAEQRMLDPLLFTFDEIKDHISPILKNVSFISLNEHAKINGLVGRFTLDVHKRDGVYRTPNSTTLSGKVGIEVLGYDMLDGTYSKNGIMETILVIDGDTVFSENKSRLSFSKQRNILVHMNYQTYKKTGQRYNKLYVDHGNTSDFYTKPSFGYTFSDTTHLIEIYFRDSYGNQSKFETAVNNRQAYPLRSEFNNGDVFQNLLLLQGPATSPSNQVYIKGTPIELEPYFSEGNRNHFIWDLRKGLPDSILIASTWYTTYFQLTVPSADETHFHSPTTDVTFFPFSLYDTLYLSYHYTTHSSKNWELFKFDHVDVPLKSSVEVNLRPNKVYDKSKSHVYGVSGDRLSFIGGKWGSDGISFRTTELTTFTIQEDLTPPFIQPQIVSTSNLYFKISDDLSGVKSYRATLNGGFLLMKYETKKNLIWAETLIPNNTMAGEFILEVEDNAGNKSTYKKTL